MFRAAARSARGGLLLVLVLIAGVAGCGGTGRDETVDGPEWRTAVRGAVGAATRAAPARLTGMDVQERAGFDRIVIAFDGPLPGSRVSYTPAAAAGYELTIRLEHVRAAGPGAIDCGLPAIAAVHRAPPDNDRVLTRVTVAGGTRLPFRIGITLGSFYVDVAQPGPPTRRWSH
jgi:hypothetical protein